MAPRQKSGTFDSGCDLDKRLIKRLERSITLAELLSESAMSAYELAEYQLSHRCSTFGWTDRKRNEYKVRMLFKAAAMARYANRKKETP